MARRIVLLIAAGQIFVRVLRNTVRWRIVVTLIVGWMLMVYIRFVANIQKIHLDVQVIMSIGIVARAGRGRIVRVRVGTKCARRMKIATAVRRIAVRAGRRGPVLPLPQQRLSRSRPRRQSPAAYTTPATARFR
jgi:hypothetical protein